MLQRLPVWVRSGFVYLPAGAQRFKQATEYAKAAMADPVVRAIYEELAAKENKRPYSMALSDYFKGKDLFSR